MEVLFDLVIEDRNVKVNFTVNGENGKKDYIKLFSYPYPDINNSCLEYCCKGLKKGVASFSGLHDGLYIVFYISNKAIIKMSEVICIGEKFKINFSLVDDCVVVNVPSNFSKDSWIGLYLNPSNNNKFSQWKYCKNGTKNPDGSTVLNFSLKEKTEYLDVRYFKRNDKFKGSYVNSSYEEPTVESPIVISSSISDIRYTISDKTLTNIIKKVSKHEKDICNCEGKDVVMFIGSAQTGKSTTINALLGTKYKLNPNTNLVELVDTTDIEKNNLAKTGTSTTIGMDCTKYPATYVDEKSGRIYVDTQGFFATFADSDLAIEGSLLMEMAIKKAKSLKIVLLVNIYDFMKGNVGFQKYGEFYANLISNYTCPVLFLFNKYSIGNLEFAEKWKTMSDEERHKYILDKELKEGYNNIINGLTKRKEDLFKKIVKKIEEFAPQELKENVKKAKTMEEKEKLVNNIKPEDLTNIMDNVRPFQEEKDKLKKDQIYFLIIKNAFEKNNVCFIDPCSEWSINNLKEVINSLGFVKKSDITLTGFSAERVKFNEEFENFLQKICPFLNDVLFIHKYPSVFINKLLEEQSQLIQKQEENLVHAKERENVDYLLRQYDDNLLKEQKKVKEELENFKEKREKEEKIKKNFEVEPSKPHWSEQLESSISSKCRIKYPGTFSYYKVEEELESGTSRCKDISFQTNKFNKTKNNKKRIYVLKNMNEPQKEFEVEYTSTQIREYVNDGFQIGAEIIVGTLSTVIGGTLGLGIGAIGGAGLGFFGSLFGIGESHESHAPSEAEALGGIILLGIFTIAGAAIGGVKGLIEGVNVGVGICAGTTEYIIDPIHGRIEDMIVCSCQGKVSLYVLPRDQFKDEYNLHVNNLNDLNVLISDCENVLNNLIQSNKTSLINKIENIIKINKKEKEELEMINKFTYETEKLFSECEIKNVICEDLKSYLRVIDKLYDEKHNNLILKKFQNLFSELVEIGVISLDEEEIDTFKKNKQKGIKPPKNKPTINIVIHDFECRSM